MILRPNPAVPFSAGDHGTAVRRPDRQGDRAGRDARYASVESYVTEQALDGLFTVIAEQEAGIRQNPAQAATNVAKNVFGMLMGN